MFTFSIYNGPHMLDCTTLQGMLVDMSRPRAGDPPLARRP
jgi:hypothetical protein